MPDVARGGFIDPLYSRGLSNTFEVVDALAYRILDALRENDFTEERFEYVERLEQGLLEYNDKIVNSSYIAFSHFRLWNAVFRVWACFTTPATMRQIMARQNFQLDGDDRHFKEMEKAPYTGLWWPDSHAFKVLFDITAETCERYEAARSTVTRPRTSSSRRSATASRSTPRSAGRAPRTSGSSGPPRPR
ncbi:hypothetical protein ACFQ51_21960 [Streptomyces kaempferi]